MASCLGLLASSISLFVCQPEAAVSGYVRLGRPLVAVTLKVKNTGSREGVESAQVYVGDSPATVPSPAKELKSFAKVSLRPGQSKPLTVLLDRRAFCYYDVPKHGWNSAPGEFGILVGASSVDSKLQGKYSLVSGEENR